MSRVCFGFCSRWPGVTGPYSLVLLVGTFCYRSKMKPVVFVSGFLLLAEDLGLYCHMLWRWGLAWPVL